MPALLALVGVAPPEVTGLGGMANALASWGFGYAWRRWFPQRGAGLAWRLGRRGLLRWVQRHGTFGTHGLLRPDATRRSR